MAKTAFLCRIYTRGAQDETENKHLAVGGHDRKAEAIRLGTSHKCKSGDHRLDLVSEGKERADPWTEQYQRNGGGEALRGVFPMTERWVKL